MRDLLKVFRDRASFAQGSEYVVLVSGDPRLHARVADVATVEVLVNLGGAADAY